MGKCVKLMQPICRAYLELTGTANPKGLEENKKTARRGGSIAGHARKEIEAETGKPVVSPKNAIDFSRLIDGVAKDMKEDAVNRPVR